MDIEFDFAALSKIFFVSLFRRVETGRRFGSVSISFGKRNLGSLIEVWYRKFKINANYIQSALILKSTLDEAYMYAGL